MPRIWWCNQTRCWDEEHRAGLVCSDVEQTERGMKFRRMVRDVRAGDVTVHYRSGRWQSVVALSRAVTRAVKSKVDLGPYGGSERVGYSFKAEYFELNPPILKSEIIEELGELEIEDGPIVSRGQIRQGYFMPFSPEGLLIIRRAATAQDWPEWAESAIAPQYWVVGAMWGGREDQYEEFVQKGYWLLGWEDADQPQFTRRRNRIRPGDRIAIKKISTHPNIEIRAIGTVKRIDPEDHLVYVHWVVSDLHHKVHSKGCYGSIHGPYDPNDKWTREVFTLDRLGRVLGVGDLPDLDGEHPFGPEGLGPAPLSVTQKNLPRSGRPANQPAKPKLKRMELSPENLEVAVKTLRAASRELESALELLQAMQRADEWPLLDADEDDNVVDQVATLLSETREGAKWTVTDLTEIADVLDGPEAAQWAKDMMQWAKDIMNNEES